MTAKSRIEEVKVYSNLGSDKLVVERNLKAIGGLVKIECLDGGMNIYQIDVSSLKNGI